ncbi:MAG: hypothetical protein AAB400_03505 [Patescibacteria group bacterium]
MSQIEDLSILDRIEQVGELRFFSNQNQSFPVLQILRAQTPHAFVKSLSEVTDKSDKNYWEKLRKQLYGPGVIVGMDGCRFVLHGSLSLFSDVNGEIISFHNNAFTAAYVNELLALGWNTNEIFMQQLATFLPFPETLVGRYEVAGFMMRLLDDKTGIRTMLADLPETQQANRIFEIVHNTHSA